MFSLKFVSLFNNNNNNTNNNNNNNNNNNSNVMRVSREIWQTLYLSDVACFCVCEVEKK